MECQVGDVSVYYQSIGEGFPVVMLHGWSIDHGFMLRYMEPLFENRPGWQRLYLDLPGHGKTRAPDWVDCQDRILEVVLGFIDKVVEKKRFALAGASAGAYLARGVLYHRCKYVSGMLLSVPLIYPEDARRTLPPPVTLVEHPAFKKGLSAEEKEMLPFIVVQKPEILEVMRTEDKRSAGLGDLKFQERIRQDPKRYAFSFDVDDLTDPFNKPVLIIAGRQDSIAGYSDAWQIIENFPRATYAVLDCAGHFLETEQSKLFNTLAGEWLDRMERFGAQK